MCPRNNRPPGLMEERTHSWGQVSSTFTKALNCSGPGETAESLLFHLFQPALEAQTPRVITGVSAWIRTRPADSVNATAASTGQHVSCAGRGDSGLTVSVCGTPSTELSPVIRGRVPCPDAYHPPELEAYFLFFPASHLPTLFSFLDISPISIYWKNRIHKIEIHIPSSHPGKL